MNCKQVEKFLPLWAGGDLESTRERSLREHLASCKACAAAASEYHETRQWLQNFAAPAFSDDVYAEMRQNVWRRIEIEASGPSVSQVIAGWFQPRWVWAPAAVLLIAIAVFGAYLMTSRGTSRRQNSNPPATNSNPRNLQANSGSASENVAVPPSTSSEGGKRRRQANIPRLVHESDRRRAPDRPKTLAMNAPDAAAQREPGSQFNGAITPDRLNDPKETLRMEIQTQNPNIRIIWFSPREPKPVSPNSKGI